MDFFWWQNIVLDEKMFLKANKKFEVALIDGSSGYECGGGGAMILNWMVTG